ncbi:MAG TPA: acyltransferase family protein [Longimicrobiales bacterium]
MTAAGHDAGSTPPARALPANARAAEIDWLRLAAVVVVLVVHAAQIFSPFESWHIASPDRSPWLGLLTALTAPWIMPLFTLLAGAGAWFTLQRRSPAEFLRTRAIRLLPPFVLGTLILIPPQVYLRRLYRGEFDGTFLDFYPRFFEGASPDGNFSWGHLWFILYLFFYFVAATPLFRSLSHGRGRGLLARMGAAADRKRAAILWLVIPFAAGQLLLRARFTQSTGALLDDWATHAWLFTALITGYALMEEPRLMAAVDRGWRIALLPAALSLSIIGLYVMPGDAYDRLPSRPGLWYFTFWTTFSLASWSWLVVLLGAARRYLDRPTPFLERWRHSAYGIYVLHQTVIVLIAWEVVRWPLDLHLRFLIISALSLAVTLMLVAILRRLPGMRTAFGLA